MIVLERILVTARGLFCMECGRPVLNGCRHRQERSTIDEAVKLVQLLRTKFRRMERFETQTAETVTSENHNGTYRIEKLPDASWGCTCLAFLRQQGLRDTGPSVVCKHIEALGLPQPAAATKPASDWQKVMLGALGVRALPQLSKEQAYFVVSRLLELMGMKYLELESRLKAGLPFAPMPVRAFGVEIEAVGLSPGAAAVLLTEGSINAVAEAYNHMVSDHWKLVHDGSLRAEGGSFELVSPKLFAQKGFNELHKVCGILSESERVQVNRSCGLHVHVDAYDLSVDEIKEIAKVWERARPVIQYLVPLSRRENGYCRPLTARSLAHLRDRRDTQRVDRYRDVNVASLARHNTIEFRLHSGTIDPHKISAWVTFVLYFVQAVKNGLAARVMPVPQNFNALGELIGMAHGPAVVWRRYCYLERRYNFFLEQQRTGAAQEEAA